MVQAELAKGLDVSASYEHDLLDNIGGGEARLAVNKSFQFGIVTVSPELSANWTSAEISNHDYGVPVNQATADRPAYKLNDVYSLEAGIGVFIEITSEWLVIINLASESLSDEVTASPIVTENNVIKGFAAINYIF